VEAMSKELLQLYKLMNDQRYLLALAKIREAAQKKLPRTSDSAGDIVKMRREEDVK
jgi:hypothetical protein